MKRMTFTKQLCASVVFSALAVSTTQAQESIIQGWSGSAELGGTVISGNSEASNVSAAIRLGRTIGRWEHLVFGNYFQGNSTSFEDTGETQIVDGQVLPILEAVTGENSNRLAIGWQPRFYWRPRTYVFGILDFEFDEPANIDSSTRQVIGIGHKFFSNDSGFLSVEGGIGNRSTEQVIGPDITGGIGYFGANYLNRINDNVTFNADFRTDFGSDNTYTELGLGLAFSLSSNLAVKISHQIRSNTDITNPTVPDASDTDNVTTVSFVLGI